MPNRQKHALTFILLTVFIDTLGLGIIIPVLPTLVMGLSDSTASEAATIGGWLMFLYGLMQFIFAPILGNLSDRFGRRPVLLIALLAFAIDYTIMGFAPTLTWLFIGRIVAGIAGSSATVANAYVADISPPEKIGVNYGLIGAAWSVGFIIGPVIGGLVGEYDDRLPFFVAAGLGFINVLYGFFLLPESLPKEKRRPFSIRRANPIGAIAHIRQFPTVLGFIATLLLYQIAHDANPSIWTYFTIEKFDWSKREIGLSLGYVGIVSVIAQGYLTGKSLDLLGEKTTIYGGLILCITGFAGMAFSNQGWMLYLFITPFCVGSIAIPAIRGIMARQFDSSQQGELQGTITSLISLTAVISPLIMTQLFRYFTQDDAPIYFPGAAFLLAAIFILASLATVTATFKKHPPSSGAPASS